MDTEHGGTHNKRLSSDGAEAEVEATASNEEAAQRSSHHSLMVGSNPGGKERTPRVSQNPDMIAKVNSLVWRPNPSTTSQAMQSSTSYITSGQYTSAQGTGSNLCLQR